jgi:glycerol kinase
MSDFVLAIDQGTTGTKLHRLYADGRFQTLDGFEHRQILPRPGWVEHDPEELIEHLNRCVGGTGRAKGIGIANQGETVVAWDAVTKRPIYNAIVWQDSRTNETIAALKEGGHEETTLARAGLPLDPYFSASKLRWLIDHVDEAKPLLKQGRLRLGTSDSFFLDRLAGTFATDVTTASRTSLMNLDSLVWDPVLCDLFGVPMECLPQIRSTAGVFGAVAGSPVTANVVDQQAALFGHGCRQPGDAKITFGTGAFALCIAGPKPLRDVPSGLLPTVAWRLGDAAPAYALDGGVYNAASALNWAHSLGLFSDYAEIDSFDGDSAISRNLAFVPALSGLGCPYWDRSAAGMWLGLGLDTTKADMVQALLEGVALRAGEVIDAMSHLVPIGRQISIDGGLAKNGYFSGFVADVLRREVVIPGSTELTGLGTAQLALIGAGLADLDTLPSAPAPKVSLASQGRLADEHRMKFHAAVTRSRNWR